MRFRGTTIRRKIVALLLIPLVSLTVIWGFAATITMRAVLDRPDIQRVVDDVAYPTEGVVQAIQRERKLGLLYVADPNDSEARIAYDKQQQATDTAIAQMRTRIASSGIRGSLDKLSADRLDDFLDTVGGVTSLRQRINAGHVARNDAYDSYNSLVTPAFSLFDQLNPLDDVTLDSQRRAVVGLNKAGEDASREDALMSAAISTGHMSAAELRSFTFAVAQRRNYFDDNLKTLPADERAPYDTYWQGDGGKKFLAVENAITASSANGAPLVAARLSWPSVATASMTDIGKLNAAASVRFGKHARPLATTTIIQAAFVGGLGLIAVIASLFVSVRIGRSLIRDLTGLRREAQEVSGTRLPRVMRRLSAGEQVDVETEVPRLQYADDEIGQVGKALNTLQRAVVESAVRQADLRNGVSDVFVNLARRSQVLLHRQLTLLDAMERRTENAEELADLFRLDHMTTRMRRHAEGLVILSGAAPSRQWRKPVQLMDVARAAIAEVEDYERIEVRRLPRLAVAGSAVADLTHLLAELIENAAVFSPPHTGVRLHGEQVANGFVLEVDDRGLGLTPDALLEANLRLAETPEFELSDTDRLGLFVVSRLAQRHGVRVSLRQSPYGGTTAVVLIPANLLSDAGDDTGGTRIGDFPAPRAAEPAADTEHTFRQWGLDGVADESQKEHAAHSEDPDALPGVGNPNFDGPVPLPRRRSRSAPVLVSDRGRSVPGQPALPGEQAPADPQIPSANGAPALGRSHQPAPAVQSAQAASETPAGAPQPTARTGAVLPRRVRQASLAPQLRADAAREAAEAAGDSGGRERSADEVRDRMASLQRGWQRGRRLADSPPVDDDPSTSVPRTTPEGNGR
jgi:signal transduction histidine kinase